MKVKSWNTWFDYLTGHQFAPTLSPLYRHKDAIYLWLTLSQVSFALSATSASFADLFMTLSLKISFGLLVISKESALLMSTATRSPFSWWPSFISRLSLPLLRSTPSQTILPPMWRHLMWTYVEQVHTTLHLLLHCHKIKKSDFRISRSCWLCVFGTLELVTWGVSTNWKRRTAVRIAT